MLRKSARYALRAGLGTCVVGALSFAGTATAMAAPPPNTHPGSHGPGWRVSFWPSGPQARHGREVMVGTIANAPGAAAPTSFTMNVATTGGSTTLVTVNLSTTTALDEPGVSSPSLSDIVTGDQVQVSGTRDASGMVDATSVTVPLVRQSGTVLSAPGSAAPTIFAMDVAGTTGTTLVTVNVGTTTTFTEPGVSSASLADILAGDQVQVTGAPDSTGVVDATSVTVPLARISGTVVTAPGSIAPTNFSISVSGTGGTTMVTVDVVTTALNEPGVSAPALGNILAGDQVQVTGTQDGTGVVDATSVTVPLVTQTGTVVTAPEPTAPTGFTMNLAGTGGTTLVTVEVTTTTTVNGPGTGSASLSDILAGDQVQVTGAQDGTGMVNATSVAISPTTVSPTPAGTGHSGFGGHGGHRHHG